MSPIISALLAFALFARGQSFEVASIRLHTERILRVGALVGGQRFTAEAMSLDNLINWAYDVKRYQVTGLPAWADSTNLDCDRYDVSAKAEGDGTISREQARAMLQTLLADRFRLQLHRDTKEMPVYALVIARNGPKLNVNSSGAESIARMGGGSNGMEFTATGASIELLVNQLSNNGVDRPVVDRTGLTAKYDYKLTWTPELGTRRADSEAPSIFTALQEQLGLRLEPQRAPVEVLVVDHEEKPSEN